VKLDFPFYLHNLVIENKFDFTKNKLINQMLGVKSEEQRAKSKEQRAKKEELRVSIVDSRCWIQDTGCRIQDT